MYVRKRVVNIMRIVMDFTFMLSCVITDLFLITNQTH